MRQQINVLQSDNEVLQPEVVQPVPFDDAATIPDDSAIVDAGEIDTATGDKLAIADEPMPVEDVPPGTMLTREQMLKKFPEVKPQNFTDWANPAKGKSGAEKLAQRGYEAVKVKNKNAFRRLSDAELKALGYESTTPENGTPRYQKGN